jgi:tripartite-type tricarboxylate transporter receptor subunit TctC
MFKYFRFIFIMCFSLYTHCVYAKYPEKPINIYVPFAAGGASETLMQEIGRRMSVILGQTVNVYANENKNLTSIQAVRNAVDLPPDGYNLIVGNLGTHGSAPALEGLSIRYDPLEDFMPVGMLGETPMYIAVRKDLPVQSLNELLTYLRAKGNSVTMAYAGKGSTAYLAAIYFNALAKINPTMLPYQGSEAAMKDLSYGYIDIMIDQSTSALPFIQSNLVRSIAYTLRNDDTENTNNLKLGYIKSTASLGLPEFDITGWNMLFAPKGTPNDIIDTLNKALRLSLKDKIVIANLSLKDTLIYPDIQNTPAQLYQFIKSEITRWQDIINISS